jgi:ABC-type sugar transport system permease subunit
MRSLSRSIEARDAAILLAPLFLLLAVFIVYPVFSNFYYAFFEWKGFGAVKPVGFANYVATFTSPVFYRSMLNTGVLVLFIPFSVAATVLLAALLREGLPGWTYFKVVLYLPNLLGPVIMGMIFAFLLRSAGPLNALLRAVGLGDFALEWLGREDTAILMTGLLAVVWVRLGFGVVYFLSSMSSIDPVLYEAAALDGAGWWRRFVHVTIPSVRFSIEFWIVLSFIEVFARMFGFIFALSRGGPGYATFTLEYGIYSLAFDNRQMGMASAWATVLFVCCAFIAVAQLRLMQRRDA